MVDEDPPWFPESVTLGTRDMTEATCPPLGSSEALSGALLTWHHVSHLSECHTLLQVFARYFRYHRRSTSTMNGHSPP